METSLSFAGVCKPCVIYSVVTFVRRQVRLQVLLAETVSPGLIQVGFKDNSMRVELERNKVGMRHRMLRWWFLNQCAWRMVSRLLLMVCFSRVGEGKGGGPPLYTKSFGGDLVYRIVLVWVPRRDSYPVAPALDRSPCFFDYCASCCTVCMTQPQGHKHSVERSEKEVSVYR